MKAPPAVQATVERFGLWRALSATLGALAAACAGAGVWAWVMPGRSTPLLLVAVCAAAGGWLGARGASVRARRLAWDGRDWFLSDAQGAGAEPVAGSARLMIDLGGWMLLRFDAGVHDRPQWLPLHRKGLEPAWHALRCALIYSARPSSRLAPDTHPQ